MKPLYTIVKFDPKTHSVSVRWFADTLPEEFMGDRLLLNYNLPIPTPSPESLKAFLLQKAPLSALEHLDQCEDPSVDTSMSALIAAFPEAEVVTQPVPAAPERAYGLEKCELDIAFQKATAKRVDDFAKALGYFDMSSLVSYTESETAKWRHEAREGRRFRDHCWRKYVEQLKLIYNNDADELPSLDSLVAQLPGLTYEAPETYPE